MMNPEAALDALFAEHRELAASITGIDSNVVPGSAMEASGVPDLRLCVLNTNTNTAGFAFDVKGDAYWKIVNTVILKLGRKYQKTNCRFAGVVTRRWATLDLEVLMYGFYMPSRNRLWRTNRSRQAPTGGRIEITIKTKKENQ